MENKLIENFKRKLEQKIEQLHLKDGFLSQEATIVDKFSSYNKIDLEHRTHLWDWFKEFILQCRWTRGMAYYFLGEFLGVEGISEELKIDIEEYLSTITGNGIRTSDWMVFPNEPTNFQELDGYIHSRKWLDEF